MASASGPSPCLRYPFASPAAVSDLRSAVSATATTISNPPPADDKPVKADGAPGSNPSTPAHASNRVLDITIPDAGDAASIHTTDGRVKNPVPSKLKGKADNKNGNFGVMHIDINSSQAALRNAAAKRTSEETEAAAKLANMRGYQSIKRSKLAWNPQPEQDARLPVSAPMTPQNGHPTTTASHTSATQSLGPSPREAKVEQARLLTLLRSLHPLVVVDQLCRALAFFGGIPGAPPSGESLFPDSAKNNGQGSLFIGWIAEIFPPAAGGNPTAMAPHPSLQHLPPPALTNATATAVNTPAPTPTSASAPAPAPAAAAAAAPASSTASSTAPANAPAPVSASAPAASGNEDVTGTPTAPFKRPRGRPKGSKSSKPRKDKGISKSDAAQSASNQAGSFSTPYSSSVNAGNLSQTGQGSRPGDPVAASDQRRNMPANVSSHPDATGQPDPDSSMMSTPGTGKKRGRPKGSKNRPKNISETGQATPDTTRAPPPSSSAVSDHSSRSPLIQRTAPSQTAQVLPSGSARHAGAGQQPSQRDGAEQQAVSMGTKQSLAGESSTAPATKHWTGSAMQPPESNQQQAMMNAASHSLSHKRKAGEPVQRGDAESAIANTDASPRIQQLERTSIQNTASEQAASLKRRRVSRETHQNPVFNNMDTHSPRVGIAASPIMNNSFNGVAQSLSSGNFDAQVSSNMRNSSNQHFQQHNLQQPSQSQSQSQSSQHHQQQNQQFSPQKAQQQQASAMRLKPQHQQGHMPMPGGARPRSQMPAYGAPQANMGSTGYYAQQRQISGQLGQVSNAGGAFARGASGQASPFSPNMATRQGPDDSSVVKMIQQNAVNSARNRQGQNASRQASDFGNHQQQQQQQQVSSSSAPTSSLDQFPGFGEHNYLGMDYSLNERDVQDAATAFGDSSQLEAALVEPNIRERLYQAMNRR